MMIIWKYMMMGALFMLFIDILYWVYLKNKDSRAMAAYKELNFTARMIMITIWPIAVIVFIKAYIDSYDSKD